MKSFVVYVFVVFQAFGCQELTGWRQELSGADDEGQLLKWVRGLKWNWANDGSEGS